MAKALDFADLIGLFTAPLVVYPSPWSADLPEWITGEIQLQRLVQLMSKDIELATDAEALAYMYPAVMESPINHEWAQIYLYLGTQVMRNSITRDSVEVPPDINVNTLSEYEMGMLKSLKRKIRARQFKHIEGLRREMKREEKVEKKRKHEEENPQMELIFEEV